MYTHAYTHFLLFTPADENKHNGSPQDFPSSEISISQVASGLGYLLFLRQSLV